MYSLRRVSGLNIDPSHPERVLDVEETFEMMSVKLRQRKCRTDGRTAAPCRLVVYTLLINSITRNTNKPINVN